MNKAQITEALTTAGVEFPEDATKKALAALLADHTAQNAPTETEGGSEGESGGEGSSEDDGDETPKSKSIVPPKYKVKYKEFGGTCGDDMATVLKNAVKGDGNRVDVTALETVMVENGLDSDKWGTQNVGQRRMNLGNVLRARIKRGEFVQVGTEKWNETVPEEATA